MKVTVGTAVWPPSDVKEREAVATMLIEDETGTTLALRHDVVHEMMSLIPSIVVGGADQLEWVLTLPCESLVEGYHAFADVIERLATGVLTDPNDE